MFFWKKRTEDLKIENPEADVLYAPISGKVIPLEQVDDMVFSQKIMGDGIAIEPEEGRLYAPVSGTVSVVFPTGHVVGIEGTGGANVIMHVGIDTVELKGQGFDVKVKQGDTVKAGTLLMGDRPGGDPDTLRRDHHGGYREFEGISADADAVPEGDGGRTASASGEDRLR